MEDEGVLEMENSCFENFFMAMDDIVSVSDYNGNILYINNAVQNKLGYSIEEAMDLSLLDFYADELKQEAMEIVEDMLKNNRRICPLPFLKKDGSLLPVETRVWFGKWDNKDCIYAISKDLSCEQESLQRLLKIYKEIPAYVILTELPTYKITDANNSFINKFGYTEKEVLGKTPLELGILNNIEDYKRSAEDLEKNGKINEKLVAFKTKDGEIIKGMVTGTIIECQGKKFLMSFIDDMTESIIIRDKLIKKGNLQSLLVKLSSKYINIPLKNLDCSINSSLEEIGKFVGVDRTYIFDYDLKKGTTSNLFEWCNEGISPEIDNLQDIPIDSIPDWVNSHFKGEMIYIPNVMDLDGDVSEVKNILMEQNIKSLITIPMMKNDKCIGYVGFDSVAHRREYTQDEIELLFVYVQILVNTFNRKEQEGMLYESKMKAQQASDIKSRFIAKISHEIRTPLNGALGFLELLNDSQASSHQIDYIGKAKSSMNVLLKLVDDLRDITKIEANNFEIKSEPMNIRRIIVETIAMHAFDLEKKGLKIKPIIGQDVPNNLIGDEVRLRQIISNLINNAIKHTNRGTITLNCSLKSQSKDKVELFFYVKDTGEGIPKKEQPFIFDSFYQSSSSTFRSITGLGLGLHITKELVSKMDGDIWVESNLGEGTTFFFTIKLREYVKQDDLSSVSWENKYKELHGIRVLLAEDNEINQEIVVAILNKRGIKVDTVDNGLEAIKALSEKDYDLVLMDIQMPVMDGLEATRLIRKENNIPIIAMTATVMAKDKEVFLSSGINCIIEKPLSIDLMLQEIYKWTKLKATK